MSQRLLSPVCVCVLLGAAGLLVADESPCPPATPAARTTSPQPTEKVRPVPAGSTVPAPKLPSAPFPPASGSVSRAAPADPPVPSVAVRVRVPAEVSPGQELAYQITAENVSKADAHHVTVRVPVPANAKYVRAAPEPAEKEPAFIWKLGTLRGSEKKDIRLVVTASGDGEVTCCARVQFKHGQCVKTKLTRPGVQINRSGPVQGAKNDLLKFKIEVANTGKVTAKDVQITEKLPPGLSFSTSKPSVTGDNPLVWKLGDLEPGKSRIVEYDAIADAPGKLTPAAVVTAAGGVKREASHAVLIGEPALSVTQSGPKERVPGRSAVYRLTVRNTGTFPAKNVDLEDELPGEIEFVGASAGGKLEERFVRWSLGTLAPGEVRAVQMTVKATTAGTFKNVCTARAARDLAEQAKAYTGFAAAEGLAIEFDKGDEVPAGQATTWTLRLANLGQKDETNAGAVVEFPAGLTVLSVSGAGAETKENKVLIRPLPTLAAGRDEAVTVRLKADKAGEYEVSAAAYSDKNPPGTIKVTETLRAGAAATRTSISQADKPLDRARFATKK